MTLLVLRHILPDSEASAQAATVLLFVGGLGERSRYYPNEWLVRLSLLACIILDSNDSGNLARDDKSAFHLAPQSIDTA